MKMETECGLTVSSVNKWDDKRPSADKLKVVADYFGVSMEYLLTGIEKQPTVSDELLDDFNKWFAEEKIRNEMLAVLEAYRQIDSEKRPVYLEILQQAGSHKE